MAAKHDPPNRPHKVPVKSDGKVPVYLSTSNPPKPRPVFLVTMIVVTVVWIGILAYLAVQHVIGASAL